MDREDRERWQNYRCERPFSPLLRDELILRYTPLVRYVANRMKARLPANIVVEDLISCGMFGLIDAIDRFEPEREVKFETYAVARIQGSILDELRAMDWAPRSVRSRMRQISNARDMLGHRLGRTPTLHELAAHLDCTVADITQSQWEEETGWTRSLQADERTGEDESGPRLQAPDLSAEDPVLNHEVALTRTLMAKAVTLLPVRERVIAAMYWRGGRCPTCWGADQCCGRCEGAGTVTGLTLAEISGVLGVSESWVCQTYTAAALGLREHLADLR